MRILAKIMILASVVVGVATAGTAGTAHASTVRCDEKPMDAVPGIVVTTCAEADGDLRRTQSIVVNHSDRAIELRSLLSLISFPEYALTQCGASQLGPGAQAVCVTGWVVKKPSQHSGVASFTQVFAVDTQGRSGIRVFNIHTTF
jgi:hypothetical protein